MTTSTRRARNERIGLRATPEDRAVIDRAVEASSTDLASVVIVNPTMAARRVLAGRTEFVLDAEGRAAVGGDQRTGAALCGRAACPH